MNRKKQNTTIQLHKFCRLSLLYSSSPERHDTSDCVISDTDSSDSFSNYMPVMLMAEDSFNSAKVVGYFLVSWSIFAFAPQLS